MWSDAARQASIDARKKASGHNAGGGNRKIAKKAADDHKSVVWGAAKGALVGSIIPGVGTVAGGVIGGVLAHRYNKAAPETKAKILKSKGRRTK